MRASSTTHAVDGHGHLVPVLLAHDRPGWFQEVEIPLEGRNGQGHAPYALGEPWCPGVGAIDKPVGLNGALRRFKSYNATAAQPRAKHFRILLHSDAQLLCA